MKRFSAHYVFTGTGAMLKHGIITTADDGTIIEVRESSDGFRETQSVQFFNGIILPGFVNAHCHLELSHLKGAIAEGGGLPEFLMSVRSLRSYGEAEVIAAAKKADDGMHDEGIVLCADICNTSVTFPIKKKSKIRYINLLEVFGIDPASAQKRMDEVKLVAAAAGEAGLQWDLVPHSAYSLSLPLFRMLRKESEQNSVTSIHFMESASELLFLKDHAGPLMESYRASGLLPSKPDAPPDHLNVITREVTGSGNLVLIHNTYADRHTVAEVKKRGNTWWAICPGSNLYIEGKLPPVAMLDKEGCDIVIGTDSLSSNHNLSILEEMKLLQDAFPHLTLDRLIQWGTLNGARALGEAGSFGSIEAGKKPGLLLIEDLDIHNLKLLPESRVMRLV